MSYQPIENYGMLAHMVRPPSSESMGRSTGFVFHASIPEQFAALLDDTKGGRFQIAPTMRGLRHKQFYWPDTNVLVTRFLSADGVGQITDFMPVGVSEGAPGHQWLVRRVNVVRGSMAFMGLLSLPSITPETRIKPSSFRAGPASTPPASVSNWPRVCPSATWRVCGVCLQEGRWPSSSCARCNPDEAAIHCSARRRPTHSSITPWTIAAGSPHVHITGVGARCASPWCSSCSPTSPRGPLSPPPPVACRKSWGDELGLPLYLDPRYLLHAVRPAADRFHR